MVDKTIGVMLPDDASIIFSPSESDSTVKSSGRSGLKFLISGSVDY